MASDVLASFSRLSAGVAPAAFGNALAPGGEVCRVTPSGPADLMDLGVVLLPTPADVTLEPIGAGGTLTLASPSGSYVELAGGPSERFYVPATALPDTAVPDGLVVDVPGDEFPAFANAALPDVETLAGVTLDSPGPLTRETRFTWRAGSGANASAGAPAAARIRIETTTAGGFFLEDGIDVACLVPDTGEFVFPPDVRAALGDGFSGESPTFSRVALRTERRDGALLVLVRESLVP